MHSHLSAEIKEWERTVIEHPLRFGLQECDVHFLCMIPFNFTTMSEVGNFAALQTRKLGPGEVN